MQPKISLKLSTAIVKMVIVSTIILVLISSIIISFSNFHFANPDSYAKASMLTFRSSPEITKSEGEGLPIQLKIPSINIDAAIEYVGLMADGSMAIMESKYNVAWFNLGPHPGDNGSAVIAGHYGRWKNGEGSVFDNLDKLSKGDKLYVENDQGISITFVVRESRSYDPNADASEVFNSNDGKAHLNLITCEGVWDGISKSYPKRLVIFTDKEI